MGSNSIVLIRKQFKNLRFAPINNHAQQIQLFISKSIIIELPCSRNGISVIAFYYRNFEEEKIAEKIVLRSPKFVHLTLLYTYSKCLKCLCELVYFVAGRLT